MNAAKFSNCARASNARRAGRTRVMQWPTRFILSILSLWLLFGAAWVAPMSAQTTAAPRALMAHYMPWYANKQTSGNWGWHWTMNHFAPDQNEAASKFHPTLGLYDSSDPDVLECHVLWMKLAGIDGVIFDWYGPDDYLDYGVLHRNCEAMLPYLRRAGLKFAVCYEDQSVKHMIEGGRLRPDQTVEHGQKVMRWLEANWFAEPNYLRVDGRPLLMVFGPQFYQNSQWPQLFMPLPAPPTFLTLHERKAGAQGAFDWPLPQTKNGLQAVDRFYARATDWPISVPVAFARFDDIYAAAGLTSYGEIADDDGQTYRAMLRRALQSGAPVVQIATWNDWGEGTQIEPSHEFGTRDLEATQRARRETWQPNFAFTPADLSLPLALFRARKRGFSGQRIETASRYLFAGQPDKARPLLQQFEPSIK